ncbi:unnamed protein product [Acanthoscelides obtectus]|uniref:Uncharacterized protein n=1 Tax=Acanthoscelides obtectus TaxID=200917 RepID=A0A9P0P6W7_ACAOB|nr:unnamed protein product [Acanthoscelides obtectus]CAK1676452.1 hypothetical protein AOBTE_LOCUS30766 [Acanthoscelides obtectus]
MRLHHSNIACIGKFDVICHKFCIKSKNLNFIFYTQVRNGQVTTLSTQCRAHERLYSAEVSPSHIKN